FPGTRSKPLNLLKLILNTLWILLGLIAISYLFVDENHHNAVRDDFKRALYIGIVLSVTIIVATTTNIWFRNDIQKKIESKHDPTSFKFLRYVVLVGIYF